MKRTFDKVVSGDDQLPKIGMHHNGSFQVYFAHKIAKLQTVHTNNDQIESNIFKNCVIFVNGITNPPVEEIRRLVGLHGGQCLAYRMGNVTHLVCEHFTDAQLKQELSRKNFHTSKAKIFYVTASWVVDSIRLKSRQAESKYTPQGMRGRFGGNIATMFQQPTLKEQMTNPTSFPSSSSSSSSSARNTYNNHTYPPNDNDYLHTDNNHHHTDNYHSSNNTHNNHHSYNYHKSNFNNYDKTSSANNVIELTDTPPPSGSQSRVISFADLSLSQQEFILSLPLELQGEALQQIQPSTCPNPPPVPSPHVSDNPPTAIESAPLLNNSHHSGKKETDKEKDTPICQEEVQQLVDYIFSPVLFDFMQNYPLQGLSASSRTAFRQRLTVHKLLEDAMAVGAVEHLGGTLVAYGQWLLHEREDLCLLQLLLRQLEEYRESECFGRKKSWEGAIEREIGRVIKSLQGAVQTKYRSKLSP